MFCVCPQVREGSRDPGGEQGGPGKREGGVVQRRPGPGRGVGVPLHGDLGQEQNHGGRTVRRDRSADGLRRPAGQGRPLLLLLHYTIAPGEEGGPPGRAGPQGNPQETTPARRESRAHSHMPVKTVERNGFELCGASNLQRQVH